MYEGGDRFQVFDYRNVALLSKLSCFCVGKMCVIDKTGTACLVYLMLIRCQVEVEDLHDIYVDACLLSGFRAWEIGDSGSAL